MLEYVPRSLIHEIGSLDDGEKTTIFKELMAAVSAVHRRGIVHGDIKLENTRLTEDGQVKIVDFGTSTFIGCDVETPGTEATVIPGDYGTPAYMCPKGFEVLEYDRRLADLWALGVLAHALFAGFMPWSMATATDAEFCQFINCTSEVAEANNDQSLRKKVGDLPAWPTCTIGKARVVGRLPTDIQGMVSDLLEPNPYYRVLEDPATET